ncbi:GTP-binding protein [Candidatus Nomurabacteria bacterium]|nr:GTP-binding protein [Candidatus Nomurabacteria bacterium]
MIDKASAKQIRNIAIIAHVDHGKTTLVDAFMKQSNTFRANQEEMEQDRILDSNDLERERGITISAKNISIHYKGYTINIIDTPGHADFGGEVERTLNMAEGCILVVDAQEGVMPQTKSVLRRAFEIGLKPIVVINKIDKKLANVSQSISRIQDLFLNLATDESQLDFKIYYAIARDGKVFKELPVSQNADFSDIEGSVIPLLEAIVEEIPAPSGNNSGPFQMQISSLDFDPHYGRYVIGKINRGAVSIGDGIVAVHHDSVGAKVTGRVKGLFIKEGLDYKEMQSVEVGQIVAIAGLDKVGIGDTVCDPEAIEPLPDIKISPPSLKIRFEANTSPFLGKESKYPNWKQIQARLDQEAQNNVGLKIENNNDGSYSVSGRGELHLAILIESMRREGYEFQLRKPEVITKVVDGVTMEPVEEVYIEVAEEYYSQVSQEVNARKGELIDIVNENGLSKMTYKVFTRNLIGLRRILLSTTKGELLINSHFLEYAPLKSAIEEDIKGRIVSNATGKALAYALNTLQERGDLLINPNIDVYEGMIIGLNKYQNDMFVNPTKAREKNNVRMSRAEITLINLKTPIDLTLELAISMIRDDEILEVTPHNIRLRKIFLNKEQEFEATKRKKAR